MPKTIKTAAELADMIMAELRMHPECSAVKRIGIIRPVTKNWDATIVKPNSRARPLACHKILEATVQRLRVLYDLSEKKWRTTSIKISTIKPSSTAHS